MYIHEKGLASIADFFIPVYHPLNPGLPELTLEAMFDGCIIYSVTHELYWFVHYVLPNVTHRFKLITGLSDCLVPYMKEPDRDSIMDNLLNSEFLIQWFGVNRYLHHPKITPIPIGIPRSRPFIEPFVKL